ncbi:MAG: hypothetical protein E6074_03300, partial [Anaerococcus sp.]|nr:hypothetical protein [Anaerococcus sp.]
DYVALISSESNEIYIFYYEDSFENDEIDLKVVDDEEELDEVFHLFTHYWDDESLDKLVDDYDNDIEHFADDEQVIEDNDTLDE